MFRKILNFIFPLNCGACGALLEADYPGRLCEDCLRRIVYSRSRVYPLPEWLDDLFSCCSYEGVIRDCIHHFKYRSREYMAKPLGAIMAECLESGMDTAGVDALVPVPLHWRSRARRGFNQSELLARELLSVYDGAVSTGNLVKRRNTLSQVGLSGEERLTNISDAFLVKAPGEFEGRTVLLVDDVCTTGSTLNECARLLKSAGSLKVYGAVIAHGK